MITLLIALALIPFAMYGIAIVAVGGAALYGRYRETILDIAITAAILLVIAIFKYSN